MHLLCSKACASCISVCVIMINVCMHYPGMCVSAGGLTESLVRASSDCLLLYISQHQDDDVEMDHFSANILHILRNYQRDDRVVTPMLKMLDILLSSGSFDVYNSEEKTGQLFNFLNNNRFLMVFFRIVFRNDFIISAAGRHDITRFAPPKFIGEYFIPKSQFILNFLSEVLLFHRCVSTRSGAGHERDRPRKWRCKEVIG